MRKRTALELLHAEYSFSSRRIAEICDIDIAGFARVERGIVQPTRATAHLLHKFYRGAVALGVIYDAAHPESLEWWKNAQHDPRVNTILNLVRHKHPQLTVRRLDSGRGR